MLFLLLVSNYSLPRFGGRRYTTQVHNKYRINSYNWIIINYFCMNNSYKNLINKSLISTANTAVLLLLCITLSDKWWYFSYGLNTACREIFRLRLKMTVAVRLFASLKMTVAVGFFACGSKWRLDGIFRCAQNDGCCEIFRLRLKMTATVSKLPRLSVGKSRNDGEK